jgi:hypothetical protein
MILRASGPVLARETVQGGSGDSSYRYELLKVLTGKGDVTPIRFTDRFPGTIPNEGDDVDLHVDVSGFAGRAGVRVSVQAVGFVQGQIKLPTSKTA